MDTTHNTKKRPLISIYDVATGKREKQIMTDGKSEDKLVKVRQ